jgi:hypothetical protein
MVFSCCFDGLIAANSKIAVLWNVTPRGQVVGINVSEIPIAFFGTRAF